MSTLVKRAFRELLPFLIVGIGFLALVTAAGAQTLPVNRTLQAAATAVGPGVSVKTTGFRYKTVAIEISGTGTIRVECSIDNGVTYDIVTDTTLTEAELPPCGPPPNRCLLDVPVSCTDVRTPIVACTGCTISSKLYAEQ